MIDDVLDIIRSEGRWMNTEEIRDALMWKDPVRYRTATRAYVVKCVCNLMRQGFDIEKRYEQNGEVRFVYFHYVGLTEGARA